MWPQVDGLSTMGRTAWQSPGEGGRGGLAQVGKHGGRCFPHSPARPQSRFPAWSPRGLLLPLCRGAVGAGFPPSGT